MKKSLIASLAAFVLVWIFVVPESVLKPSHDAQMVRVADSFTDSDGARIATDQALYTCYQIVLKIGKEYAEEEKPVPPGLPEFIWAQCLHQHGQWVSERT